MDDAKMRAQDDLSSGPPFGPELVIYDMDGVITAGDTFGRFVRGRVRRLRLRHVGRFLANVGSEIRSCELLPLRIVLIRSAVVAALEGMSEREYEAHIKVRTVNWARTCGWVNRGIVREIEVKRAAGAVVVIATACERRLAEAMLRAAGVTYDVLSASALHVNDDGCNWEIGDYRIGQRKAEALQEQGLDLATATFTTDSIMDAPVAERCARTVVVCSTESDLPAKFSQRGIVAERWIETN